MSKIRRIKRRSHVQSESYLELKDVVQFVLTLIGIGIAVFSLFEVSENTRADRERQVKEHAPYLETGWFLANSVDLTSDGDIQEMERLQVRCVTLPTTFWTATRNSNTLSSTKTSSNTSGNKGKDEDAARYAFAFIHNKGADRAKAIRIENAKWVPAANSSEPTGWFSLPGSFPTIGPDQCYALLVGVMGVSTVAQPIPTRSSEPQSAPSGSPPLPDFSNFRNVVFTLRFTDIYDNEQTYKFDWQEQGPFAEKSFPQAAPPRLPTSVTPKGTPGP